MAYNALKPGHETLKRCQEQVILAIKNNFKDVAMHLRNERILSDRDYEDATEVTAQISKNDRVQIVFEKLTSMVNQNNYHFITFLTILQKHTNSEETVKVLVDVYVEKRGNREDVHNLLSGSERQHSENSVTREDSKYKEKTTVLGLDEEIKSLDREFAVLVRKAVKFISDIKLDPEELKDVFKFPPGYLESTITPLWDEISCKVKSERNVREILKRLHFHLWNFLDYDIMQYLIDNYGTNELKGLMNTHADKIESFKRKTKVMEFSKSWNGHNCINPPGYIKLETKHEIPDMNLMELDEFRKKLVTPIQKNLPFLSHLSALLHFSDINGGCILVSWHLLDKLSSDMENNIANVQEILLEYHIVWVKLEQKLIYHREKMRIQNQCLLKSPTSQSQSQDLASQSQSSPSQDCPQPLTSQSQDLAPQSQDLAPQSQECLQPLTSHSQSQDLTPQSQDLAPQSQFSHFLTSQYQDLAPQSQDLTPQSQSSQSQECPQPLTSHSKVKSKDMSNTIKVVVCGLIGAGKSTLCNAIIGKHDKFKVGDNFESVTDCIKNNCFKWSEGSLTVYDTVGFDFAGNLSSENYFKFCCKLENTDLLLYCIHSSLDRTKLDTHETILKNLRLIFPKVIIVLTQSDTIVNENELPSNQIVEQFNQEVQKKVKLLNENFLGIFQEPIPIVTTADISITTIIPGDQLHQPWLPVLLYQILKSVGKTPWFCSLQKGHPYINSSEQLQPEIIEERYQFLIAKKPKCQPKPELLTRNKKIAIHEAAITGGGVATVVGATIGGVVGTLAIGLPTFGTAAGAGLVIGAGIGAAIGASVGGIGAAIGTSKKKKKK